MERYEIKAITEGQFKGKSLLFHIQDYETRKNCEFTVSNTNLKSMNQKIINLEYYALEFGCYTSEKLSADFFNKSPELDIQEILNNSLNPNLSLKEMLSSI